ncbi:MAG: hypothetical protein M3R20_03580 [Pseudomonadota bacterium]|nr:hypothetical protein [Pseudomonadota bacterium]
MVISKFLDRVWIGHGEIMAGGELRFVVAAQPNRQWGVGAAARPYSMSAAR